MPGIDLIATAAFGVEALTARELKNLGYGDQRVENGRIYFKGDEAAICRSNIWLRTAERVLLQIGRFEARTFEELFEKTKALPWPDWLPEKAEFPVIGKSVKSTLFSVSDCQAIVKKAIVEKMKQKYKVQWFEETGPKYKIEVSLLKDVATLSIDTSGAGLHKRGYRTLVSAAPVKETMASAMVYLSRWYPDRLLIDPLCGSGTIPIEAALQGLNIAPGIKRNFAAENWQNIVESSCWAEAREEAQDSIKKQPEMQIMGFDIDDKVLSLARYHAKEAGVEDYLHFQRQDVGDLQTKKKYGYLICNPPYGERLEEVTAVEGIYKMMGKSFNHLDTWSYFILTPHPRFEVLFGKKSDKNRKLYNGNIMCYYYQYFGPRPPRPKQD